MNLWNVGILHFLVLKNLLMIPILSHVNLVNNSPLYFSKNYSNIILSSKSRSSKLSLPSWFRTNTFIHICSVSCMVYDHLTHVFQLCLYDTANNVWWRERIWSSYLCNFLHRPVTSFSGPNIPFRTLLLRSIFRVAAQGSLL